MNAGTETYKVVGTLYHDQVLREYVQAGEQLTLNAMVMLCLTAREFDQRVKYVLLDDSDQGDWQVAAGLAATLPLVAGDYAADPVDLHDLFDDEGWASCIDERTKHVWEPYTVESEPMSYWRFLDVDKVLAEVHLPWRPVTQVTEWSEPSDFEVDGAPSEQWEVTTPNAVNATDDEPTEADLAREMGAR